MRLSGRTDIFDLMLKLAREYGLDPVDKSARYVQLLRELPAGLSEWALYPALDIAELLAIEPEGNHIRQTDFDFLISQETEEAVIEEGIILLDYRPLQEVWRGKWGGLAAQRSEGGQSDQACVSDNCQATMLTCT